MISYLRPLVGLAAFSAAIAAAQPTAASIEKARSVPIADLHMHTYQFKGPQPEQFLEQMDKNGVVWGGAVGDYREDVAKLLGPRYIPAVGQREFFRAFSTQGPQALVDDKNPIFVRLFEEASRLFDQGKAKGFGELHTDNHTSGPANMRRHIRTDNPVMRRFFEIADRHRGFVQIHSQLDEHFVDDILRLTADYPNVLTILSHCLPVAQPADLERMFSQRANLVCEMSAQGYIHNRLSGLQRPARVFGEAGIRSDWRRFIEAYPDRIMVGTDACCGWFGSYSEMVQEIRTNFLPHLEPELMEKLAYKNAVRLLGLKQEALK